MSKQAQRSPSHRRAHEPADTPSRAASDSHIEHMAMVVAQNRAAERHALTAQAAYYRAQQRGFEPGHELEDWLAAEEEVARSQVLATLSPPTSAAERRS